MTKTKKIISLVAGMFFLVVGNLITGLAIYEQMYSTDPKAGLGMFFSGLLNVPITVGAIVPLILSGWKNWYIILFLLPLFSIMQTLLMMFGG
jgi:hypothetical protein